MEIVQQGVRADRELVLLYGIAYIEFAVSNPQMWRLMLSQTNPGVHLDSTKTNKEDAQDDLQSASKRPYVLLRECFSHHEEDPQKARIRAQGAWGTVHGLAALIIEGHIKIDENTGIKELLAAVGPKT